METKEDNSKWYLIRTNNGEWISDEYAECLSSLEAAILKGRYGNKISIQHGPDGRRWCYKHQLDALRQETVMQKSQLRKLKIEKSKKTMKKQANAIPPLIYKGDKPFKREARTHQSDFRANVLNVPFDPKNKYGKYGAFLMPEDAIAGLNFYEGFRQEILQRIERRYPKLTASQHDGLYANMLRSEHIPWNLFVPMMHNHPATANVFKEVLGTDEIDEVTDIRIEWTPDKEKCLNDNTSFDTYIEFLHDGKKCGIGIEVKYTEEGYQFGEKERKEVMENDNSRYAQVTKACGWFVPEIASHPIRETELCKDEYRQIWRNHILGASMVQNNMQDKFYSITIYPKGNPHFGEVLPAYETFLTDAGRSTFGFITIESLIDLLTKHFPLSQEFCNWIQYLKIRYPF